jgi:hypothetical protein
MLYVFRKSQWVVSPNCRRASTIVAFLLLLSLLHSKATQASLIDVTSTFSGSHSDTDGQAEANLYGSAISWPAVDWSTLGSETIRITLTAGQGNRFSWSAIPEVGKSSPYAIFTLSMGTGNEIWGGNQATNFGSWTFENATGDTPSVTPLLGNMSAPGGDGQFFHYQSAQSTVALSGTFTSATFVGVVPAGFDTNFSAANIIPAFHIVAGAEPFPKGTGTSSFASISVEAIPEPSAFTLAILGLLALGTRRHKK